MELAPTYRAARHRRQAIESLELAMKAHNERSLALLIDTAIESCGKAKQAEREAQSTSRH
jgi:hypothetical protein